MSRVFDKDPLQEEAIEKIASSWFPAALNGSGTGAGKTYVGIRGALERGAERVLIIAQPKVLENFKDTLQVVSGIELRACANSKFRGVPKADAVAAKEDCMAGKPGWYFVSRELFMREMFRTRVVNHRNGKATKKRERIKSWDRVKGFDFVLYDECQMAASKTSKSAECLRALDKDFLLMQSADWFGGEIENEYHVAYTLWPEWMKEQYEDFSEWRSENCTTKFSPFRYDKKEITGEKWPGFFASTFPTYVRIPSTIEKPEPDRHFVELTGEEAKIYAALKKNMAAMIGGKLLSLEMPMTLFGKLREVNLGVCHVTETPGVDKFGQEVMKQSVDFEPGAPSSTVNAIREIMERHEGEPVIVLTHSRKFAQKAAIDLGGLSYTGKETDAQKARAEAAFLAGEVKVLVGTEAMAEGLDGLQRVCRIAIIASRPGKNYMTPQFIGRVARRGQERDVQVYELLRLGTLDEVIRKNGKVEKGVVERALEKELMLTRAKSI